MGDLLEKVIVDVVGNHAFLDQGGSSRRPSLSGRRLGCYLNEEQRACRPGWKGLKSEGSSTSMNFWQVVSS